MKAPVIGESVFHDFGLPTAARSMTTLLDGVTDEMLQRPTPCTDFSVGDLLDHVATAWTDPGAWEGTTRIGGGDVPAAVAGAIGVEELVVHGWDLARATGQEYISDDASLEGARAVLGQLRQPGSGIDPSSRYGAVVVVAAAAPLIDQVLALSGRDPGWTPR